MNVHSLKQAADFVDAKVEPSIGRMQVWMRTSLKLKYIPGSTHFRPNLQLLPPLVKVKCIMGQRAAPESKYEQVRLTLLDRTAAQKCPGNQVERSPTARLTHLCTVTFTFPLLVDRLVS